MAFLIINDWLVVTGEDCAGAGADVFPDEAYPEALSPVIAWKADFPEAIMSLALFQYASNTARSSGGFPTYPNFALKAARLLKSMFSPTIMFETLFQISELRPPVDEVRKFPDAFCVIAVHDLEFEIVAILLLGYEFILSVPAVSQSLYGYMDRYSSVFHFRCRQCHMPKS